MNTKQYERLVSLVETYYHGEKEPLKVFVSTLRGSERKIMEEFLNGNETVETDRVVLHCMNVLSVRMKNKNSPYGYYHRG